MLNNSICQDNNKKIMNNSSIYTEIGGRIREIRIKSGKNQSDFAKSVGTKQRNMSTYESGKSEIPLHIVTAISEEYDKDLSWVILGKTTHNEVNQNNSNYSAAVMENNGSLIIKDSKTEYFTSNIETIIEENKRLKSELKKAERIIELLEKK